MDVFFYGLFMDAAVLDSAGVAPKNPRRAYVADFQLRIGERATLVPSPGARAYGMLFTLTQDELDRLYGAPGLERYRPESVTAHTLEGDPVPATCYNLPEAPGAHERNPDYASRLRSVLTKLGFPGDDIAGFVYIWEFEVAPDRVADFERHYGPDGTWAELFRRSPGYLGTQLLKDAARPLRYLTIDRWRSVDEFSAFKARFRDEYDRLDARFESLTTSETAIGDFGEIE